MLHLRISFLFFMLVVIVCFVSSCGLVDLRQIGVKTEPGKPNTILPDAFSPVIVRFDTPMIKNETEGNLHISSDLGVIRGDLSWQGNDLYFVPISGWSAGIRYTLSLQGTLRTVDGREARVEHFVSFFAINNNTPPLLETHWPPDGTSVSTNNFFMEFSFTKPMDRFSVESALTLEGIRNTTYEWSDDDKILKATSGNVLSPWGLYRWNLTDSAKSKDGVSLPKTYSGYFITDLDQILPQVLNVYPVLFTDGSWFPAGTDIETGLRHGQGIAIAFNKPMNENTLRSIRFEPSLTGRAEFLSENSIVYIFTRDPEPGITYTLIISGDVRDQEGLRLGADYRINFTPDIPILNVVSINFGDEVVADNFSTLDGAIQITVNPATGEFSFTIYLSQLFNDEEKQNTPQKIRLIPFFPRTLPPVALKSVNWLSGNRLYLRWEGLAAGKDEISNYYKLIIPGGRGGISSETGIFMPEDITIYLEAIE